MQSIIDHWHIIWAVLAVVGLATWWGFASACVWVTTQVIRRALLAGGVRAYASAALVSLSLAALVVASLGASLYVYFVMRGVLTIILMPS